ncbi:MAG: S-layer homology domain-containing protein [Lawsonibacter sp.]|nr:S-layer homology domain-containing protein [Lawsonibacter sp.]
MFNLYYGQSYTVSTNAFTRTNYTFTGWNMRADGKGTSYAAGGTLTRINSSDPITFYAQRSPTGSGSNPGSGGSSTAVTPNSTVSGSTVTATVTPTISNGKAAGSVTQSQLSDALKKAQKAAGKTGSKPQVEIKLAGISGATSAAATIPGASAQSLAASNVGRLTVSSSLGSVTFDAASLKTISSAGSGDVTVTVAKADTTTRSDTAKRQIGSRPVYSFKVTNASATVSQFNGTVTGAIPYTPVSGEDPNAIVVYYINAQDELETVTNGHYAAAKGTVVLTTDHFSTYAVGYNKVSFSDVSATAWYTDAVTFLAAHGITSGTTTTKFSPDATLTRGQFITMLLHAYEISPDSSSTDNFADAGSTYYTSYLAAAKRLGITSGVGDNLFAPEQTITRQEMFTLLYNALKQLDKLPSGTSGKTLSDFADASARPGRRTP